MRFALAIAAVAVFVALRVDAGQTPGPCGFQVSNATPAPAGEDRGRSGRLPDLRTLIPLRYRIGTAQVTGPSVLVARLSVVPQPDSPVEIAAIDLTKMAVIVAGSSYRVEGGSSYAVALRNRSDQPVYEVQGIVGFRLADEPGESGMGWIWKGTLAPGETAQTVIRNGGGTGSGGEGELILSGVVQRVRFKDCTYLPSRSYPAVAPR